MTSLERRVRALVTRTIRDTARAPTSAELARTLHVGEQEVRVALRVLADRHLLVLRPGTDDVWMAAPFSSLPTDFVVRIGDRSWFANCVWDGLSVLGLLGDGSVETHSPATGEALRFTVRGGVVAGDGIVHFLVPARCFWDDIGFT